MSVKHYEQRPKYQSNTYPAAPFSSRTTVRQSWSWGGPQPVKVSVTPYHSPSYVTLNGAVCSAVALFLVLLLADAGSHVLSGNQAYIWPHVQAFVDHASAWFHNAAGSFFEAGL